MCIGRYKCSNCSNIKGNSIWTSTSPCEQITSCGSDFLCTSREGRWPGDTQMQGGLAAAFDLAAFQLSMTAPVKKSVNHSRTVASMRETNWEKQQEAHLRSDSTVWSEFAFIMLVLLVIAFIRLCRNQSFSAVMWSLRFPFFWSCVCHYMRFTTLRTKNETSEHVPRCPTFWLCVSVYKTHKTKRRASPLIRM